MVANKSSDRRDSSGVTQEGAGVAEMHRETPGFPQQLLRITGFPCRCFRGKLVFLKCVLFTKDSH